MKTKIIKNLASISDGYDSFIIDVYGVVFDGKDLVDGGVKAIYNLMQQGKNIALLSNSPRPSHVVRKRLCDNSTEGYAKELFTNVPIFTSGDIFARTICGYYINNTNDQQENLPKDNGQDKFDFLKGRGFVVGAGHDHHLIREIDDKLTGANHIFRLTTNINNASYIIMLGFFSSTMKNVERALDNILSQAAAHDLVCLCPNPDKLAPDGNEQLYTSGFYANRYVEVYGKNTIYFGKPFSMAYEVVFNAIPKMKGSRVLCIGDSLHHDVAGAISIGCDSLFIRNSIHHDLSYVEGGVPT